MPVYRSNKLRSNFFTAMLLALGIVLLISVIYFAQRLFYRHQSPQTQLLQTGLHKISGFTGDDVYDLSGSEGSGYGNPMKLFDENADPANGDGVVPQTNPLPNSKMDIYYPTGRGLRIVVDLHNVYAINHFYLYDKALEKDSVWVYTGDMHNWKLAAALQTAGQVAAWGWKNFTVHDSSRYVMIRFNSHKSVISELVMYGDKQTTAPPEAGLQQPALPAPTLREFAGTNSYDYVPPYLLQAFQQTRLYQMMDWYDADTVNAYPNNKLSLNIFNLPEQFQLRNYADSLKKIGNHIWLSIRGMPKYLIQKGLQEKDKPVTKPGMDTEDPLSYGRHARTFWTMAAVYGNTKVDTRKLDLVEQPAVSGLGMMDRFENGNEEDGYWTKYYWSPMDYFAMSSADYDGHEGKLGIKHGLRNADSSSKLMTSGMIQLDTNRVKTLYFLCRQLRSDKKFIWEGGVQYHYYSNDAPNDLAPPTKGVSPEEDHLREKLAKVRAFHDRLLPGIPLILGENGYDRNQHSWQKTPLLPGYNEAQSQGIMVVRSLIAAFMSGFDGYNQFMMRSASNNEDGQNPYATSGMIGGPGSKIIYPAWYYWNTAVKWLGDFVPDVVLSEAGKVWIYRLKSRDNTGRHAYVLVSPTNNGSIIKKFSLKIQEAEGHSFTEIHLKNNSATGEVKTGQVHFGSIYLEVGESPVIIVVN